MNPAHCGGPMVANIDRFQSTPHSIYTWSNREWGVLPQPFFPCDTVTWTESNQVTWRQPRINQLVLVCKLLILYGSLRLVVNRLYLVVWQLAVCVLDATHLCLLECIPDTHSRHTDMHDWVAACNCPRMIETVTITWLHSWLHTCDISILFLYQPSIFIPNHSVLYWIVDRSER